MSDDCSPAEPRDSTTLGRIPLKQVRVKREAAARTANPMNRLVPYLDLFWRLDDTELGRLGQVEPDVVSALRKQVIEVDHALVRYVDLLPRLSDAELVRLTGATEKTIRFWRLCQPRPKTWASDVPEPTTSRPQATVPRSEAAQAEQTTAPAAVVQEGGLSSRARRHDTTRITETEKTPAAAEAAGATTPPPTTREIEAESPPGASRAPDDPSSTDEPSQPAAVSPGPGAPKDSRVTINPAAQETVDSMMTFSGAPFPGYGDEGSQEPPPEEISLED